MVNYENAKIYLLKSKNSDKVYVGSTCEKYLSSRLSKHKYDSKLESKKISAKEIYDCGDIYIELYECFNCSCKEELLKREKEVIKLFNCVNKQSPINSIEETKEWRKVYKENNKEKIKEQGKEYYENNKDKIKEYRKGYLERTKEHTKQVRKKYEDTHKDKIQERLKKNIKCECGMEIQHRSYKRHLTRKIHKKMMNRL